MKKEIARKLFAENPDFFNIANFFSTLLESKAMLPELLRGAMEFAVDRYLEDHPEAGGSGEAMLSDQKEGWVS